MLALTERPRRLPLHLPVHVMSTDAAGTLIEENTWTLNVSGTGICFECHRPLEVGTPVRLQLAIPPELRTKFEGRTVYDVQAIVRRVEHLDFWPFLRVAARLVSENPAPLPS